MTAASWTEIEHLPTRKHRVIFDGANGADIAALVDNPGICQWDGVELTVKHDGNWLTVEPGDWVIRESYRSAVYPCPEHRAVAQYRVVGEWS